MIHFKTKSQQVVSGKINRTGKLHFILDSLTENYEEQICTLAGKFLIEEEEGLIQIGAFNEHFPISDINNFSLQEAESELSRREDVAREISLSLIDGNFGLGKTDWEDTAAAYL